MKSNQGDKNPGEGLSPVEKWGRGQEECRTRDDPTRGYAAMAQNWSATGRWLRRNLARGKKGIQKESINQQLNHALSLEVSDEGENGGRIMEDSSKMKTKPRHWDISCLGKYGQMR